jgi:glycosyltransferase involved in cell wall biosynthesis
MRHEQPATGNILLVANWESNVGYAWRLIENFWITISGHFMRQGRVCYLIYPQITKIPEAIARSEIRVSELDFRNRSRRSRHMLGQLVRTHNIRYLYLTDAPAYSPFYLILRLWGIKRIVVHDHTPGDRTKPSLWRGMIKKLIQRMPWFTADHFIAVTDFVFQRFIEVNCIPEKKCSVAVNGIVPIALNDGVAVNVRYEFNIPPSRHIVITTGRATYYKGIDFIIRCIAELVHNRKLTDFHFIYCGDGPDMEAFRELATRLNVNDYMTFAGKRSDIRAILPGCDIGFHASRGEVGFSLSILEYMSAGLATIVPDLPSTSLAITHGENGLAFRHGNLSSACDMLQRCRSTAFRDKISKAAMETVSDNYNLVRTNSDLIRILEKQFD